MIGNVERTIDVYERLRSNRYKVTIENGIVFEVTFSPKYYHHLAGFHYLTDIKEVSNPPLGKERFYRLVKKKKLDINIVEKSVHYPKIAERVGFFSYIEEIVAEGKGKIIVEFDRGKAGSDIDAKFFLYKREGNPLKKETVTYYNLFLGYDSAEDCYYPATYLVEHSTLYMKNQVLLDCMIEVI